MAEDTVNQAIATAKLPPGPCKTMNLAIHGNQQDVDRDSHFYVYGSDRQALLDLINENAGWAAKLHPRMDYIKAEVIWAIRHEMARTVEDVLARRVRALFLDARSALEMAPVVAMLMAGEMQKDGNWVQQQVAEFETLAKGYLLVS
jgi:glycerol-3-phosphate dehydrogenase